MPIIKSNARTSYRPDIDGLRALAVIPVVLFHAGLPGISGGFVGVDIFFVISGFLITSIILADIDKQRFSILSFYERRIRRIFPALFAVLLFTVVVANTLFLPKENEAFGKSVTATVFFVSNLLFWREAGYFDAPAEIKPLLHTWSLAVEEQFYVFFPLFLAFVGRYRKNRFIYYTTPILVLSLALSVWGVHYKPISTFYLAPTRAWELMFGALLAMGAVQPLHIRWAREILAATGLGLIAWSVVMFSKSTPFPGPNALYPCIGAGLLIYTGTNGSTVVSRLLGTPLLVFIGLISYSLYLWHWPILVFARYYEIEKLTTNQVGVLLFVILAVSIFSWRFIERPFRKKNAIFSRKSLFSVSGMVMVAFGAIGFTIALTHGWPERFEPSILKIAAGENDTNPDRKRCHDKSLAEVKAGYLCIVGVSNNIPPAFLIWGDSHADAMLPSLSSVSRAYGLSGWVISHGGCPPVTGVYREGSLNPCAKLSTAAMDFIAKSGVKNVILVAWWSTYASEHSMLIDTTKQKPQKEPARTVLARAFDRTLTRLNQLGVSVNVIAPVPGAKMYVPSALARSMQFSRDIDIFVTKADYLHKNRWVLDLFASRETSISRIIYLHPLLCNDTQVCRIADGDTPLYYDRHHFSATGGRFLEPLFQELFESMEGSGV